MGNAMKRMVLADLNPDQQTWANYLPSVYPEAKLSSYLYQCVIGNKLLFCEYPFHRTSEGWLGLEPIGAPQWTYIYTASANYDYLGVQIGWGAITQNTGVSISIDANYEANFSILNLYNSATLFAKNRDVGSGLSASWVRVN